MKEIRVKLEQLVNEEHSTYSGVAKYLLEYDGNYLDLKIKSVSNDAYCSTATVTRIAQYLGLSGFTELKVHLNEDKNDNFEFHSHDMVKKYQRQLNSTVEETIKVVNYQYVLVAANMIHHANKVSMFGLGSSQIVVTDFAKKLLRLNKNIQSETDIHYQSVLVSNAKEGDVLIFVTYSGFTSEIVKLISKAQRKKAKIIILSQNNELERYADVFIYIPKTENIIRGFSITSRYSTQMILDFIYIELISNDEEYYIKTLDESRIIK